MVVGVVIVLFGTASFFSLDILSFRAYAAEAKDTIGTTIIIFIGIAVFLFGLWMAPGGDH